MRKLPALTVRSSKRGRASTWTLLLLALSVGCGNGSSGSPDAGTGGTGGGGGGAGGEGGNVDAGGNDVSADGGVGDASVGDAPVDLPPGACAAGPVRVVQPPVTGKGPTSLGMADSDNNGLLDVDEWGPLGYMALDTDFDGQPDYQDVDDDGDGVLDVHDTARLDPLLAGAAPDARIQLAASVGPPSRSIASAVRVGDRVTLTAPAVDCASIIVLEGAGLAPRNLSPAGVDGTAVYFQWPTGAYRSVSVVINGKRTDEARLDVRPPSAPLLASAQKLARLGSPVTLAGLDLGAVTAVTIDGVDVAPSMAMNDGITFAMPASARRGRVEVKAPSGTSNAIFLRMVHPVAMTFNPAPGVTGTFETASGAVIVPIAAAMSTPVDVDALGPATATVLGTRSDNSLVVSGLAWVLPEDTAVAIDMTSTALSLALGRVDPLRQLVPKSWSTFRSSALALPEVRALAETLAANAPTADAAAGGLGLDQKSTLTAVDTAAVSVQAALEAGLAAGTLTAPTHQKKNAAGPGDPIIDPPTRNDVTPSGYGDQGNIKIENDTSMFLSAQIKDNETKRLLVWHATTAYSHKFVAPQDGLGVSPAGVEAFGASEKEYPAPSFRSAKLRVLTAGQIKPHPTDPIEVQAARALFLTTVIDRVLLPFLKELAGETIDETLVSELLMTHAYPAVVEAYQAMTKDGFAAGALTLLNFFQREFKEQGPFFGALTDVLLRTFLEAPGSARLKGLAVQGALKLAPAIEAFNQVATGVTVLKTIFDIETTPAVLEFDVAFTMSVVNLGPPSFDRTARAVDMDLKGFFLYPTSDANDTYIPFVRLNDTDPGGAGTRDVRHDGPEPFFLASNGRAIKFTIPLDFAAKAAGPIAVSVVRGSESARSPIDVTVNSKFNLTSISPTSATPGATLTLIGEGFPTPATAGKILFTQAAGIEPGHFPTQLLATPATATATQITVVVPALDANIGQWTVRVQRGPVGFEEYTNGKPFLNGQSGPQGVWLRYYGPASGGCASVNQQLEKGDVFPNGNVRWYLWDAGGGYCARNNQVFHPASGTLVVNDKTVTITRCNEDITKGPQTAVGTWEEASKAYVFPPGDFSTSATCLKQTSFDNPGGCVAKEACKIVQNAEGMNVPFHCPRVCVGDPSYCPWQNGVEADCY
jgi:hypothetical protein